MNCTNREITGERKTHQCHFRGCMQPVKFYCECQPQTALLCAEHLSKHISSPGEHSGKAISRQLSEDQQEELHHICELLKNVAKISVNQVLSDLDKVTQTFLQRIRQASSDALERIRRITQESRQTVEQLRALISSGWNVLEQSGPLFFDMDPSIWVAENIRSAELKANYASRQKQHRRNEAHQSARLQANGLTEQPAARFQLPLKQPVRNSNNAFWECRRCSQRNATSSEQCNICMFRRREVHNCSRCQKPIPGLQTSFEDLSGALLCPRCKNEASK